MNIIGTGEARRRELRNYLNDVLEGKRTEKEWTHPFGHDVTEAVFQSMKTGVEDWKSGMEAGLEKWRIRRDSLEENLEDFYDIFL